MSGEKNFLLEIFSEEIPARFQKRAGQDAQEKMKNLLAERVMTYSHVRASCAPRRLFLLVEGLDEESVAPAEEKKGPKVGAPEEALAGFLRANALQESDLIERNGYFFATLTQPNVQFKERASEIVLDFIKKMPWPKSMRWPNPRAPLTKTFPWVRPVHSVLCLLDTEPLVFDLPEWGLTTGNVTFGHVSLAPEALTIASPAAYIETLRAHFVLADYDERQKTIAAACQTALAPQNLVLKPDATLLDEVTGLVDYPFVILGRIETMFMTLPAEVLTTAMRVHQKYFTTEQKGEIAPFFLALANRPDTEGVIQRGFEKVLRSRLSDAAFFYKEDLKQPLASKEPLLKNIIFHKTLGTLSQKVERLIFLAPRAAEAARLCKLDLVSHMVGEFEELQGIMGTHYALKQGVAPEVAAAIEEHYKPLGAKDTLPVTDLGKELALADRLDSLVGFLGVGIKPTGSKDPFALRRAALGILRLFLETPPKASKDASGAIGAAPLENLAQKIQKALQAYRHQNIALRPETKGAVTTFLLERLAFYLKDQKNMRYDVVQSVLSFAEKQEDSLDVADLFLRAHVLQAELSLPRTAPLLALFGRVQGLLGGAKTEKVIQPAFFETEEERAALKVLEDTKRNVAESLKKQDYADALAHIASLVKPFAALLEAVQVHTENSDVRQNRLALLARVLALFDSVADFQKIQE